MITGVHTMFYSSKATELRRFIREKLGFPATDVGGGWLIFDLPDAELGVHPTDAKGPSAGTHNISFYCDDIEKTVRELSARGVTFTSKIKDQGYGLVTHFAMPGGVEADLYQPKYRRHAHEANRAGRSAAAGRKKSGRRSAKVGTGVER